MNKNNRQKTAVRIFCLVLAGLMVLGSVTYVIMVLLG